MTWIQDLIQFSTSQITSREREALWARGVTDDQIKLFQIGYLNREFPIGMPEYFLQWAQKFKLDDVFVFPLTTTLGEIRGFQFRHVVRERLGYMDFFVDRREPCLFGLYQAIESMWTSQSVYLVEGVFDLCPIQRAVPFVIATMTAFTTQQTARLLRRLVQRIWLGYDLDSTGRKGCDNFRAKYKRDFEIHVITYPKVKKVSGEYVKDPGDLWENWGDTQMIPFIRSTITQEDPF